MGLLFGDSFDDPKSAAIMALSAGLLKGDFGAGLLGANQAFGEHKANALKQQMLQFQMQKHQQEAEDDKRKREFLGNLPDPQFALGQQAMAGGGGPSMDNAARMPQVSPMQSLLYQGAKAGAVPLGDYLKTMQPKGLEFGKVDPKDYTQESLMAAQRTGDYTKLVPMRKMDVVNNQAVDLYKAAPGTVFDNIDPNKPFNLRGGQSVPNSAFQAYETNKARAGASNVSVNTGQKGFDNELKLRGDFRSEPIYKAHQEVQSAHSQISAALKQSSPAGDLAGATKIMKILDPGSVVRESELGMAMAATGALDRLQNYAGMVVNGTKLTPKQRADFQQLADTLYAESGKQFNSKQAEYTGIAKDYGMNPTRVAGQPITSPRLPAPAAARATPPSIEELLKKY